MYAGWLEHPWNRDRREDESPFLFCVRCISCVQLLELLLSSQTNIPEAGGAGGVKDGTERTD